MEAGMSLDVYLEGKAVIEPERLAIFVRVQGKTMEFGRDEWDRMHPGKIPVTVAIGGETEEIYSDNITHNLNKMAGAADIYKCLWRPDENGITTARQLIDPLESGLGQLLAEPETYKAMNPENGWGSYGGLVKFVEDYLAACKEYPDAKVRVSR